VAVVDASYIWANEGDSVCVVHVTTHIVDIVYVIRAVIRVATRGFTQIILKCLHAVSQFT